jgi:hypothetical protein
VNYEAQYNAFCCEANFNQRQQRIAKAPFMWVAQNIEHFTPVSNGVNEEKERMRQEIEQRVYGSASILVMIFVWWVLPYIIEQLFLWWLKQRFE